jgi:hypothetical protein
VFRNEIVTCNAMRGWWNQGVKQILFTNHFLVQRRIPGRLGVLPLQRFQFDVFEMLKRIPTKSVEDLNTHLESIDFKLSYYEFLIEEVFPLLELAIWKSRSTQRFVQDDYVILNVFSYII